MTPEGPAAQDGKGRTLSVQLYLDADGRPVGSVRCGEGPEALFVGWLALMAECSRLLDPDANETEPA
ncbi:MAG: hypothetical protein ACRDY2_08315 [Acidimicrobiales bacterium]